MNAAINKYAYDQATASLEIEGYFMTPFEDELCKQAIEKKITKEQYIRKLLERCNA